MRALKSKYREPKTIGKAIDYLHEWGGKGKVLAGGTALFSHWGCRNFGLNCYRATGQPSVLRCFGNPRRPNALINIKRIKGLDRVAAGSKSLKVGSLATLNALKESSYQNGGLQSLGDAIAYIGSDETRNLGTVGGNISSLAPGAGLVPSLLCLGSRVRIADGSGRSLTDLSEMFA